jgi:phosphoribosylglycinamide formyltransferase 1
VPSSRAPARLAVLVSGSGTNLQALLDATRTDPEFGGEVVVVASERADAGGLARAEAAGIPTIVERPADHPDRDRWERALREALAEHRPDAVVLAGFMRILSGAFLAGWPDRVVNTHPSLLPSFRGAHAVREALDYGVRVTGSTVHLVDEQVDHGPIIAQRPVEVLDGLDALVQRLLGVTVEDLDRPLRDDGPVIDLLVDQVHGAAGDLDAVRQRVAYRMRPGEGRQQRGVRVDDAVGPLLDEVLGQDLHGMRLTRSLLILE